jgi:hypothetical protein
VNKQHLRAIALADNRDRIHPRECSDQAPNSADTRYATW